MQITWFRQPAGDDPGSLNLCYHAVDIAVIRGAWMFSIRSSPSPMLRNP